MIATSREHISKTPGICGGKVCIAGHRIRVQDIVRLHENGGLSPDEIVDEFPGITLADVHAAMAYYHDHLEEIEEEVRSGRLKADQYRSQFPKLSEKQGG